MYSAYSRLQEGESESNRLLILASPASAHSSSRGITLFCGLACTLGMCSLLRDSRANVFPGDDDIIEPNGLLFLRVVLRRIGIVVAVMFQPETVDLDVVAVAPAEAGEVAGQLPVEPHRLLTVGFVRSGIGLEHEFPTLPLIEFWDDASLLVGGFPFVGAGREEAISPVFVHLPVDLHVHEISVKIESDAA